MASLGASKQKGAVTDVYKRNPAALKRAGQELDDFDCADNKDVKEARAVRNALSSDSIVNRPNCSTKRIKSCHNDGGDAAFPTSTNIESDPREDKNQLQHVIDFLNNNYHVQQSQNRTQCDGKSYHIESDANKTKVVVAPPIDTLSAPEPSVKDPAEALDPAEAAKIARAALKVNSSAYPSLSSNNSVALPVQNSSVPVESERRDSGSILDSIKASGYAPAFQSPSAPPAALSASTSIAPPLHFAPHIVRPVPNISTATIRVADELQEYENKVREEEGHLRHTLHRRIMIETGDGSYRARRQVNGREAQIYYSIRAELVGRLSVLDGHWYPGTRENREPIRSRLLHLFKAALTIQYGGALGGDPTTGRHCSDDECELEAREWTLEKLQALEVENKAWIVANAHLTTNRQRHMEESR